MSLSVSVYRELKKKIMNSDFTPGEPLTLNQLSKIFRVSRTPIKDAINQLAMEGLVRNLENNKGAIVNILSIKELSEIFQLRTILEPFAVKVALNFINMNELEIIEQRFIDLNNNISNRNNTNDEKTLIELLYDFHRFILKSTRNELFYNIMDNLYCRIEVTKNYIIKSNLKDTREMAEIISNHLKIISALKEKDGERAEKLMFEHINDASKKILNFS
jgi:DNA-binding GntR family transcriptional regulator